MCGKSSSKCEVKVTEVDDGYQVQISKDKVKDVLKPENLKRCIRACCSGEALSKDICQH